MRTLNKTGTTGKTVGTVTLVGAGPGDPDLITIKAVKALQAASLVLVDDLVNPAIVELAAPGARVVYVGKRGGCRSTPQAFIEKLMITAAEQGETVVRLKGGDPLIFGRAGEELQALEQAGIACSVVNGISAGLAAGSSLGIALTHREHAHGVVFVTGHAKPGAQAIDWPNLAHTAQQARLTLVIYMGVSGATTIQAGLLHGLPADTPVAVVQNASLPDERHTLCALQDLQSCITNHRMASPCVIIVGEVLRGLMALQSLAPMAITPELPEMPQSLRPYHAP